MLASVGNQWNLKQLLQQAALLQERAIGKSGSDSRGGWRNNNGNNRARWQKNTVHMTDAAAEDCESEADSHGGHESECRRMSPWSTTRPTSRTRPPRTSTRPRRRVGEQTRRRFASELRSGCGWPRAAAFVRCANGRGTGTCPMKGKKAEQPGGPNGKSANECRSTWCTW